MNSRSGSDEDSFRGVEICAAKCVKVVFPEASAFPKKTKTGRAGLGPRPIGFRTSSKRT